MKVERNRLGNKYTFTPEDKEDEKFLDKVNKKMDELEEENKKLKEKVETLELWLDNKEKVNRKLREELSAYDREYFDEDKKAKNIFTEECTLQ